VNTVVQCFCLASVRTVSVFGDWCSALGPVAPAWRLSAWLWIRTSAQWMVQATARTSRRRAAPLDGDGLRAARPHTISLEWSLRAGLPYTPLSHPAVPARTAHASLSSPSSQADTPYIL
jgi:hypothetical protein